MSWRQALHEPILSRRQTMLPPGSRALPAGVRDLADLVAPDGVDRRASGTIQTGDSVLVVLEVRSLPPSLPAGWLQDPALGLDLPGVVVHQALEPVPNDLARRILTRSENAGLGTLAADLASGGSQDLDAQLGLQAARALRQALAAGTDRLLRVAITISVAGATLEEALQRADRVRAACAQAGIQLGVLRFLQWEGYQATLPLGRAPQVVLHDLSGSAAAMGVPVELAALPPRRGGRPLIWGNHPLTGQRVLWDCWQATNPHCLVVAESGSGKTYTVGGLIAQEIAWGEDAVLILDPKHQEYRRLVEALDGRYLTLTPQSPYHINPLEIPAVDATRAAQIRALGEDVLAQRISVVRALIARELQALGWPPDPLVLDLLGQALEATYAVRGISADPASWQRPMPTLQDLQQQVAALGTRAPASLQPLAERLHQALYHFTRGTVGQLFNHPSTIPLDRPLLALDLWELLRSQDEVLQRLVPVIVCDFFVTVAINRPQARRVRLVLDEAHALLKTEAGARVLQTIVRIGRSLGFAATVITQSLDDLDDSDQTRVLLENTRTKLLLGLNQRSAAVARAAQLLRLNEAEQTYLAQCRLEPGVGAWALLLADGQATRLVIPPWDEPLHTILGGRRG